MPTKAGEELERERVEVQGGEASIVNLGGEDAGAAAGDAARPPGDTIELAWVGVLGLMCYCSR